MFDVKTIGMSLFILVMPVVCLGGEQLSSGSSGENTAMEPVNTRVKMGPQLETSALMPDFRYRFDGRSLVGRSDDYIRRNNRLQKAGHILLASGTVVTLTGIAIIEAMGMYHTGPLGIVSYVGACTGITTMLTSFVLLGFSRPWHGKKERAPVAPALSASRKGGTVGVVKTF